MPRTPSTPDPDTVSRKLAHHTSAASFTARHLRDTALDKEVTEVVLIAMRLMTALSLALSPLTYGLDESCTSSLDCRGPGQICDREALIAPRCRCRADFVEFQGGCHAFRRLGQPCRHKFQCQTLDVLSTCSESGRCVCRELARPLAGHCSLSSGGGPPGPGPDVRSPLRYPLWVVAVMMLPGLLFVCLAAMLKRSCLRATGAGSGSARRRRTMSVWSLSGAPRVAPAGGSSAAHGDGGALPPLRAVPTRGESARLRELLPPPYTPPPSYEETVRTKPPPVQ